MDNNHLSEDQDLLNELEAIGPLSTGQALEEQKKRIQIVEIKAMLRSRKSFNEAEKSNTEVAVAVLALAVIQVLIAWFQFSFDITTGGHIKIGMLFLIPLGIMIYLLLRLVDKPRKK